MKNIYLSIYLSIESVDIEVSIPRKRSDKKVVKIILKKYSLLKDHY